MRRVDVQIPAPDGRSRGTLHLPDGDGPSYYSRQDCLAASRHLPENAPRQIDLIGAPQRMTENTHECAFRYVASPPLPV